MLLKDLKYYFQEKLSPIYGQEEASSFFYWLVEDFLQIKKSNVVFHFSEEIKEVEQAKFENALERLLQHEPIQYITGATEFMGLKFQVTSDVLIPRTETEELVEWILNDFQGKSGESLKILDIGTGSGCIAISLAKYLPKVRVFALDISEKSLEVARQNAEANSVEIQFIQGNILENLKWNETFDILVSNPPYVTPSEKKWMSDNVLKYEPHTALFAPDETPLLFYEAIARMGKNSLRPGGKLYFEINEAYGQELINLLTHFSYKDILLKKDFLAKDRFIKSSN